MRLIVITSSDTMSSTTAISASKTTNYPNCCYCTTKANHFWDSPSVVRFWGPSLKILWSTRYVSDNKFTTKLPIAYDCADIKSDGRPPKNIRTPDYAYWSCIFLKSIDIENNTFNFSNVVLKCTYYCERGLSSFYLRATHMPHHMSY